MFDFPKIIIMGLLTVALIGEAAPQDNDARYWTESRVNKVDPNRAYTNSYIANMHNSFSDIRERYEEGGEYFYSNALNTFGQQEALNPQQEVIFCRPGDRNFTSAVVDAASRRNDSTVRSTYWSGSYSPNGDFKVEDDSTTSGLAPDQMTSSIREALINNSNNQTKGRFCYDENNYAGRVDYRNPSATQATYCDPSQTAALTFEDEVSGFGCGLNLDIPLKAGETRFIRQLQDGQPTIAQGFVGCYNNPSTGHPEVTLIQNPDSCSPSSRGECLRTCDWADQVVCSSQDMPSWGGACQAVATQIFKDDTITVEASRAMSVDSNGRRHQGQATMSCQMVGSQAQWVVTSSSCTPVSN